MCIRDSLPPRHEQGAGVYGAVLRRAQFRADLSRTGGRYGQPLSVTYARATGAGSFPFPDFILPLRATDAPGKPRTGLVLRPRCIIFAADKKLLHICLNDSVE